MKNKIISKNTKVSEKLLEHITDTIMQVEMI